jgi:nitrite reductase (NADH) large subunit
MNMISDPRERLVVIGNGMAGMRTVEELLKHEAGQRYRITVFGAEPHVNYNRIMLSSVLAGDKSVDDIVINSREWYDDNDIRLFVGDAVTAINREAKTVTAASGLSVPYDRLLIATGSRPVAPPIPGLGLPGVCAFRDIADVDKMLAAARTHKRAVVIGGGLLGLEAAWGLKQRGMSVALVHLMPTLMERQLDAAAGQLLQRDLDRRGIAFFTDGQTEEILGVERAEGVQLADGRCIPADLVVLAIGISPTSISPARRDSTSTAASPSTTTCAPAIRTSSRSANALSIAARCSASLRRCGIRRGFAPRSSPATRRRRSPPKRSQPASRSLASTSSRPAR